MTSPELYSANHLIPTAMTRHLILFALTCLSLTLGAVPPRYIPSVVVDENRSGETALRAPIHHIMPRQAVGQRVIIPRIPVIIVNYADMSYRISRGDVDSMFNAVHFNKDGATGSVRQYFHDQSYGQYEPVFDVYGPVTVSQGYAYYGAGNPDIRPGYLVTEACNLVNDSVDFTLYDSDNNGDIDLVYVLYAGPPESDGDYIDRSWISKPTDLMWPHFSTVSSSVPNQRVFDGKTVRAYEVSAELDGFFSDATTTVMAGIGLACHEFGHGLGLPDVYPANKAAHKTSGCWDVMDYGCYNNDVRTPAGYTAYERWFMGWMPPQVLAEPSDVTMSALSQNGGTYLISATGTHNLDGQTPSPADFYLLENRQRSGWDAYLPGHGLIITHVNWSSSVWSENSLNNNASNMRMDLIEADGLKPSRGADGYVGKAGDCFPAGATYYTPYANYPITDISETNGIITFKFMGGKPTDIQETDARTRNEGKVLENGRIVILHNGHKYNLLGYRL